MRVSSTQLTVVAALAVAAAALPSAAPEGGDLMGRASDEGIYARAFDGLERRDGEKDKKEPPFKSPEVLAAQAQVRRDVYLYFLLTNSYSVRSPRAPPPRTPPPRTRTPRRLLAVVLSLIPLLRVALLLPLVVTCPSSPRPLRRRTPPLPVVASRKSSSKRGLVTRRRRTLRPPSRQPTPLLPRRR